jgi:pyruvate/2-oxoglutarate dehydrogenase complex dihydrolipoamide acyltransferase (E2) component
VEGGTITLSNLGMHGVEGGTPLVTSPQATVAFFGAIVKRPWVVEGRMEVHPVMSLSVGYDHRILDGVTAARFTTALRAKLEGVKQS